MSKEINPVFSEDENVMTLPDGRVFDAMERIDCRDCDMYGHICSCVTDTRCCDLLGRGDDKCIIWKLRKP